MKEHDDRPMTKPMVGRWRVWSRWPVGAVGAGTAMALLAAVVEATAPTGRYELSTLDQVATVLDTRTRLTWQGAAASVTRSWADALAYCGALGPGWRLPSVEELETLVDETVINPAIDPTFSGVTGCYWTLTPVAPGGSPSARHWCLHFLDGRQNMDSPDAALARCVRN